jgi:hypothetical protein
MLNILELFDAQMFCSHQHTKIDIVSKVQKPCSYGYDTTTKAYRCFHPMVNAHYTHSKRAIESPFLHSISSDFSKKTFK